MARTVEIDLSGLIEKFPVIISDEMVRMVMNQIANAAHAKWVQLAADGLQSSRTDYIQGIQPVVLKDKTATIQLVGTLPTMIELGWEGGFLHETLLDEEFRGVRISQDGSRYRAIPFRHKAPTSGHQGGQPMGSQFIQKAKSMAAPHATVADAVKLGKKVHRAAKKLQPGQRLKAGLAPKLRPHHTTDIFAGMKVNKQPVGAGKAVSGHQRTYTTFRTISDAVPDKWFHPGIAPRDYAEDVAEHVGKIAAPAFEAFIKGVIEGK